MKWTPLLTLVLVGLVAGDGAWKLNQVYNYALQSKSFVPSQKSDNQWLGVMSRAYMSIQRLSDNVLICQITRAEYGQVDAPPFYEVTELDFTDSDIKYIQWPLNKPFKMNLRNGAIWSLTVDSTMTNDQINQLKVIASQFQVNTNSQMSSNRIFDGLLRNRDRSASQYNSYKIMEAIATGNCETTYDISPLPDYIAQSHRDLVPLPELRGEGEFLEIVKTRNGSNCNERSDYHLAIAGHNGFKLSQNQINNDMWLSEVSRIVISGSVKSYTLQSSTTLNKVAGSGILYDNIKVTLESVEQSTIYSAMQFGNMRDIGNLIFTHMDDESTDQHSQQREVSPTNVASKLFSKLWQPVEAEEYWSGCWTLFPAPSTICKAEFGVDWEDVDHKNCGFLGLGQMIKCKHSYHGCEATPCFSVIIQPSAMCATTFGNRLPEAKGKFLDCAPGFYRSRCCPRRW